MESNELSYFERRIQKEIEDIEERIKTLNGEKMALQRQLAKARADRTGIQSVTRKNSANRVLAENAVIGALQEANKPMSTRNLYRVALSTNFDLIENTLRTYLHRMKKRGIIKTSNSVGVWELPKDI